MQEITFKAIGQVPLMINGPATIDPIGKWAKALSAVTSKRKKTEEDHEAISKIQWHAALDGYFDESKNQLFMPAESIFATIQGSAKMQRLGKQIERGLIVDFSEKAYIKFPDSGKSLEKIFAKKQYVDRRPVGIGTSKVMATRPIFEEWEFKAKLFFDPKLLDVDVIQELITNAGKYVGLGTYRKFYGRYSVEF